ncbi:MAG: ABC-F family ATP-binding cassette domain-containing protein [Candidatus Cryptobacteroides sp.]|nr:ABC-F family ATP-binding cassette domain-containing protein [Bacteroidales bacterium]MDY3964000.1 ABC-F family ATP-binding cassette domain-containing protein [Candidatus Cryptobacteroides sp.]
MASYLQIENISKSYGPKVLFEHIGFNINEGDKIALIAPNGTGKTTLLRILAGNDKSDSGGKITFLKNIRIAFLEQEYAFEPEKTVFRQIMDSSRMYTEGLDEDGLFSYELRVNKFISNFGLSRDSLMKNLSGGEVKRVALARMLASEADFFIMDEPTNHLDIDAIEYLENYLGHSRSTLLMVTHDRYFLDRVCNIVMELDHGAVYTYRGNYRNYLEKRQERIDNYNAETAKVNNILRRELEWIHSSPCARTGKARYRINAFHELKERASQVLEYGKVSMDSLGQGSRLGSKIIDCKNLSFRYGQDVYLDGFTYNFQRFERVGIVGKNGCGKSTFLNILTGSIPEDGELTGIIERGESLKIGYYRQGSMSFNEDQTVLETVGDTHLLNQFLFSHDMFNTRVSRLSGGERRRLYLMTILSRNPNLLIMDEPTNDLDIVTLDVLEEYLKEFKGSLIIVSHDRHFLDRIVDHLFIFCGNGVVKDFIGSYSEYHEYLRDYEAEMKAKENSKPQSSRANEQRQASPKKKKLTYKEQKELEQLEKDLEALGAEKLELESAMSAGTLPYDKLQAASARFGEISSLIDEKELRWLELQD